MRVEVYDLKRPYDYRVKPTLSLAVMAFTSYLHWHGFIVSGLDCVHAYSGPFLVSQWSRPHAPVLDLPHASTYVNLIEVTEIARQKFQAWHDNNLLHEYLEYFVQVLNTIDQKLIILEAPSEIFARREASVPGQYSLSNLFSSQTPHLVQQLLRVPMPTNKGDAVGTSVSHNTSHLQALIKTLWSSAGSSKHEQNYVHDLQASLDALGARNNEQALNSDVAIDEFKQYREQCKDRTLYIYEQLCSSLCSLPHSGPERTVQHWPRVSPMMFLKQLAHDRIHALPPSWKTCIVDYGISFTMWQQAIRLVSLLQNSSPADFINELLNSGHQNWNPYVRTDALLMEVESGIMIRKVQAEIAQEMFRPSSGSNAVMQLNMGEGKSTVIIPIVAAALANGSQLVRVIVAKPQSKQMAEMLIAKLGGLVSRKVFYMPFARSLKLDSAAVGAIHRIVTHCKRTGGVLLVQPEHILSFRLMAPECYVSNNWAVGRALMEVQDFFDQNSRDIVDESDENFSVRFELIYTMGVQQIIELSPHRWNFMQEVLDIVKKIAPGVLKELPSSIEVHSSGAGRFPRIRLLRNDAAHLLVERVAMYIRDNSLAGFQMARQTQKVRDAIFEYITVIEPSKSAISTVENGEFWRSCTSSILLLRGILAGGILIFVLSQKRWRVNYGLAARTPPTKLAVPYRAKDSPTPRSEFSRPDVVINLTLLCYYYDGLSDDDMFAALGHLIDSDQAGAEYQAWVQDTVDVPIAFQHLQGINLKDRLQCILQVFPRLRKSKAVVDNFLSHLVFPKEIKEFPKKLSASGWDIGKQKALLTTGFSGTNDSRDVLPLHMRQLDLAKQKHTNALVLEYLLQPKNGIELMPAVESGVADAEHLLTVVTCLNPPVQVILDVGAQILEYDDLGLATKWLSVSDSTKEAVVFVNNTDELCVVDRKGRVELLQTSPLASRLDACLVFLDESHTRGIDLKLPPDYRAAVTLGANLTKDRLVQACMRMRKLGKGQTVVFCISQEVQTKIRDIKPFDAGKDISLADVLFWSISETHKETRRSMPLWAIQGERFVLQEEIWQSMQKDGRTTLSETGAQRLLEEEAQSIDHRYRPRKSESILDRLCISKDKHLKGIAERCHDFDNLEFNASTLQEEQERELSPEIEQERQVQKAPPAEPLRHSLHQDVLDFVRSGKLALNSLAYMPAFESLKDTSCSRKIELHQFSKDSKLLVTADFARTVVNKGTAVNKGLSFFSDNFQRHVGWVVTKYSPDDMNVEVVLIVSEYEANLLLPRMKSKSTALHKYKARCNAGFAPLDKLELFTVSGSTKLPVLPRSLSVQLSVFAGQLYITSYEDYVEICRFLGISVDILTADMEKQGWKVSTDGFILRDGQGRIGGGSGITKSPVNFLKILMSKIRRHGDGISKTDMGSLLDGKPFQKSHWE